MKRTLSLLVVLALVFTMIPAAFATDNKDSIEMDELVPGTQLNPEEAVIGQEYTTTLDEHYYIITPAEAGNLELTVENGTIAMQDVEAVDGKYAVEAEITYTIVVTGAGATWKAEYAVEEETNNAEDPEKLDLKDIGTAITKTSEYDVHYYEVTCMQLNRWELATEGDVKVYLKNDGTLVADAKAGKNCFDAAKDSVYQVVVTGAGTPWALEVSSLRMSGITLVCENMIQVRCAFKYATSVPSDVIRGMLVFDTLEDAKNLDEAKAVDLEVEYKNGSYYGYSEGIRADRMIDNKFYVGYIEYSDGTRDYTYIKEYGVMEYTLKNATTAANPQKLKDLCNAIAQYGAAAQTYMGYKPDNLLNAAEGFNKVAFDNSMIPTEAKDWQVVNKDETTGFIPKAVTLVMEGAIVYRIRYQINSDIVTGTPCVEYQCAGKTETAEMELITEGQYKGYYYARATTIRPQDMDQKVIFTPYFESNGVRHDGPTLQYGALKYLHKNLIESPTTDAKLKPLLEAIAVYINKVDLYFS